MSSDQQKEVRLVVLISGNGSNLQALIDAQPSSSSSTTTTTSSDKPQLPSNTRIVRVLSNRKGAHGLTRASNANIPTTYHNLLAFKKKYPDDVDRARREYDLELAQLILQDKPDLVVCAGWMHVLSEGFLGKLKEGGVQIINLHPALPGQFNGANAIERAHAQFMDGKIEETGVMIHYVISEVDMGEPINVVKIPLSHPADDDIAALEERVHGIEHAAIVKGTCLAIEALRNTHS